MKTKNKKTTIPKGKYRMAKMQMNIDIKFKTQDLKLIEKQLDIQHNLTLNKIQDAIKQVDKCRPGIIISHIHNLILENNQCGQSILDSTIGEPTLEASWDKPDKIEWHDLSSLKDKKNGK